MHMARVTYIDTGMSEAYLEEQASPRTFKSHFQIQFLPDNVANNAKVLIFKSVLLVSLI